MPIQKYINKESKIVNVLHWKGNDKEIEVFCGMKIIIREKRYATLECKINHPVYVSMQICVPINHYVVKGKMTDEGSPYFGVFSNEELLIYFDEITKELELLYLSDLANI